MDKDYLPNMSADTELTEADILQNRYINMLVDIMTKNDLLRRVEALEKILKTN